MEKNDLISLIGVEHGRDALLQPVSRELPPREVFCSVKSITRAEWVAVGHRGLKPAMCVTLWAEEYQGELTAEYDGQRYGVYRTYQPNSSEIELYLEKKGGV